MTAATAPKRPVTRAAELLHDVYNFLGRFVAYPSEAAHVAHTLWIAHTYFMDQWESTPRIAFLSPEPGSGKSRALEVTEPLVPRPVHAVNTTPAYLFRKVSDEAGLPVILYDEIDTVFGPKAKDNEDVRGMLNAGHRRGAVAGRCVTKGKIVMTEELPAYCAVALAGLDDLPDTIRTRSVIIRMRRRRPSERVEPWRYRIHAPEGQQIADRLEDWSKERAAFSAEIPWPDMPDGIEDRNADVWEPLLAIADLVHGDWPQRARVAAVALVAAAADGKQTLRIQLLADLHRVFDGATAMHTDVIVGKLNALEVAPWGDLRGKELDARGLANRLRPYDVHPVDVRLGDVVRKGYKAEDLADAWSRYLSAASATSATSATPDAEPVADVADVADKSEGTQTFDDNLCPSCDQPSDAPNPRCSAAQYHGDGETP